jgi:pimeloyl-ACP methyl ester carboxylesterase
MHCGSLCSEEEIAMNTAVCEGRRRSLAAASLWPAFAALGCAPVPPRVVAGLQQPTLRFVQSNGIRMRVAEQGHGPLVLLLHGWPESWYSWRQQIAALAAAGYHVVAPDMRGHGQTDAPADVADYSIQQLTADVVGLVDAMGEKQAVLVGHDWGAIVAWQCSLLHPLRFSALVALSVPYGGRGAVP